MRSPAGGSDVGRDVSATTANGSPLPPGLRVGHVPTRGRGSGGGRDAPSGVDPGQAEHPRAAMGADDRTDGRGA